MAESRCYIGSPGGIILCVDRDQGQGIEGRLYHGYSAGEIPFRGYEEFVRKAECFLDELGFPHRGTGERDIEGNVRRFRKREGMTKVMKEEELLKKHGDLGTFVIRIQQRQHSSWQGRVTWLDKDRTVSFRSALELLKIIDGVLDKDSAKKEEPLFIKEEDKWKE